MVRRTLARQTINGIRPAIKARVVDTSARITARIIHHPRIAADKNRECLRPVAETPGVNTG